MLCPPALHPRPTLPSYYAVDPHDFGGTPEQARVARRGMGGCSAVSRLRCHNAARHGALHWVARTPL